MGPLFVFQSTLPSVMEARQVDCGFHKSNFAVCLDCDSETATMSVFSPKKGTDA